MTANRWWVKAIARWLARVDGVKGQVQMVSLAVTAFSTFSIMLQGFGLGSYVPYVGIIGILGGVVYTYYFAEGGVWNQLARDRQDMSNNFAGPNSKIQTEMMARALRAGEKGAELSESERNAVKAELDGAFAELRDGIELDEN